MIDYFASLYGGDRDLGLKYAARRLGMLILTADLSSIDKAQFEALCRAFDGISTKQCFDAKDALLSGIHGTLMEHEEYREDITSEQFAHERAVTRANVLWDLGTQKRHLADLKTVIEKLDDGTCVALLARIEEVCAGHGDGLSDRCTAVYEKMQGRHQL